MKFFLPYKRIVYIIPLFYLLAGVIVWYTTRAFYFEGDSAMHYLIARYAPQHPELYFHHWGKPFFTLIASPFAQFGTDGIVTFNLLCMTGASWFTYKTAKNLNIKYSILVQVIFLFTPFVFITTLSGLTEPFSAFLFSLCLFLFTGKNLWQTAIILSFLPFCRSEGLILISGFAFLFLIRKNFLPLILLGTGTFLYSIAGLFAGKSFWWTFTEIPYARLTSQYGSGNWSHFAVELQYVTGLPVYIFLVAGLLFILWLLFRKKLPLFSDEIFVSFVPFLLFFAFHTIAWATGSFSSMGLKRVFVTVLPCIAIIAVKCFDWTDILIRSEKIRIPVQIILVVYLLVFPFMPNPAAFKFPCEFRLHADHLLIKSVTRTEFFRDKNIFSTHPFVAIYGDIDPFDTIRYNQTHVLVTHPSLKNSLVVWDSWFALKESCILLENLKADTNLVLIKELTLDYCKTHGQVAVFAGK